MAKRTLYLVRHGDYTATTGTSDEPDGSLTERGREQALALAARLKGLPIRTIHHKHGTSRHRDGAPAGGVSARRRAAT